MHIIKVVLLLALIMVFLQDLKERQVYWFLFPLIAICSGIILYRQMFSELFLITLIINIAFVLILLSSVVLYSNLKMKQSITKTFGLGDGLLFLALAFTFPSVTFLILFVFGLIFSLIIHLFSKNQAKSTTVPLAGYLSLFFAIAYLGNWVGLLNLI
jgi:hypothetical protein